MKITVIIPAHNEAKYIARCLRSINTQVTPAGVEVETIVVLNRCTDDTQGIATSLGATVVVDDRKNISAIKNTGVAKATSEWIITIDADSWMSEGVVAEVARRAGSAHALGGGIRIEPERRSPGISVGFAMMLLPAYFLGLSFGLYWFRKTDFDAIAGFDPSRHIAEDVDFLTRLKAHGRKSGRRHEMISTEFITTSCRKFDQFGDWHFVRIFSNPLRVRRAIIGADRAFLDKNWYEVKR